MDVSNDTISPLIHLEARLRNLLPAKLYAEVWINPTVRNLTRIFNHLRTLQRILYDYLPRQVLTDLPLPGQTRFTWEEGTLMFTDLAGFTPLLEANAGQGKEGAQVLLDVLNGYFAEMLGIVSKAGGNLLEFTGDALLVQFPTDRKHSDTSRAVRAALRMQRAMQQFEKIEVLGEQHSLGMRIGLHVGQFLTADIGTPQRMEHVLLGASVLGAKHAEGAGEVDRVNLSLAAQERVATHFKFDKHGDEHVLAVDNFTEEQLGDYDIIPSRHRLPSLILFDTSKEGLVQAIADAIDKVEPLASYLPRGVLKLLVENAANRRLPPDFPFATVMFINLLGLPDMLADQDEDAAQEVIATFSRVVSLINAEVEARGGIMKKVTYHHAGPDIMVIFGVPDSHTNDTSRAAQAALSIREMVEDLGELQFAEHNSQLTCHIGIANGRVFAAEFGEPQGRREFNVMGNVVNTAARLMDFARSNQILLTEEAHEDLQTEFELKKLEGVTLKGLSTALTLYELGQAR